MMFRWKTILCAVFAAAMGQPGFAQQNTTLDISAMKNATIVIPQDAIPSEQYAAEEFQSLWNQIANVKLPISTKAGISPCVWIGSSEALQKSGPAVRTDDLGLEGFRIRVSPQGVAIVGGRPRGTLYGVYEFFEKYFGVRFLTEDHTYIPPDAGQRRLPCEEFFYAPPLDFRHSYYGETRKNPAFAARLRCNAVTHDAKFGGVSKMRVIGHSFYRQIPSSRYGKEHPEYYCMIDGKRRADVNGQDDKPILGNEPCLTNPDVLRIVTASVLEDIKQNPELGNFPVSTNDNFHYCRCPKCAAVDKREESHAGTLLEFVNAVADEVAKKYPDVKIGTLIYQYTRKPPKTIMPRPNVQLQLCSIECSQVRPLDDPGVDINVSFCNDLKEWGKRSKDIRIWCYNTNFYNYLLPCPNLRNIEPNIRLFVNNQVRGVLMQAAGNARGGEFSDLRNYVTSRLLWNPNQSGQALIDEFLDLHYGKAAPPIRRFINLVHDNAVKKGCTKNCFATGADYGIDDSIAQAGLQAFEEAMKLAETDEVRTRVEKASICAYRAAVEDAWEWIYLVMEEKPRPHTAPMPDEIIRKTRPYASILFQLCEKHGVTNWDELVPIERAKQLFREAYRLKDDEPI